ncbi:pectate lyase [Actinocrispum wychmicini]|uniref:Parallel beta helix pectate lyase-like protein n=1 Tax=Actinocrispum wychmicini TaxID=1213861 RepID=A0A4R2JIY4_9PSEU|nr:pectate lyase [Actinocrispum wychmicini]TCO59893.1 hypothetical protein EV192_104736 [Actinocrispum wychmicini]
MRAMMRGVACGFMLVAMALPGTAAAAGRTVYVDCTSPTNGSGTQSSPINSMPNANAVPLAAGDQMLFRRGTTCKGQLWAHVPGSAGNPIVYGAYGSGALPHIEANGNLAAVWVNNAGYVTVQDLELSAMGDGKTARRGVWVQATDAGDLAGITLQRLNIHDVRGQMPSTTGAGNGSGKYGGASGGIVAEALGTSTPTSFTGLTVQDNTISAVDRQGIYTWSNWCQRPDLVQFWSDLCTKSWHPITNTVIRRNTLSDIGGDGIAPMTSTGGLVEHNSLIGFNIRSGSPNAGMWTANSDDMLFQYNDTTGGHSTQDGMAYDVDHSTNRVTFQYNRSWNNDGGFFLLCPYGATVPGHSKDFVIRYNLSVNDHARTIQVCSGGVDNGRLYNNTIYVPDQVGSAHQLITESATNDRAVQLAMTNNIWTRSSSGQAVWTFNDSAITFNHDLFFNVPVPSPATGSLTANPALTNPGPSNTAAGDYRPLTGSPVVNAGVTVSGAPATDFFGTAVGSPPSVGFAQS